MRKRDIKEGILIRERRGLKRTGIVVEVRDWQLPAIKRDKIVLEGMAKILYEQASKAPTPRSDAKWKDEKKFFVIWIDPWPAVIRREDRVAYKTISNSHLLFDKIASIKMCSWQVSAIEAAKVFASKNIAPSVGKGLTPGDIWIGSLIRDMSTYEPCKICNVVEGREWSTGNLIVDAFQVETASGKRKLYEVKAGSALFCSRRAVEPRYKIGDEVNFYADNQIESPDYIGTVIGVFKSDTISAAPIYDISVTYRGISEKLIK